MFLFPFWGISYLITHKRHLLRFISSSFSRSQQTDNNTKMCLKGIGSDDIDRIRMAHDRIHRLASVNTILIIRFNKSRRFSWFSERLYRGADKSLARPTSRCILFDGENISFHASLVIHINSNIPPILIINRVYEHQNLLSL